MRFLALALLLVGCTSTSAMIRSPNGASCALTCIGEGHAATAGHCAGSLEPVVSAATDWCGATARRAAVQGETVTVRGFAYGVASERASSIIDANWLGWVLIDGRGQPGESGGGVYGSDGALLGIVVETHDGMTWARRLPSHMPDTYSTNKVGGTTAANAVLAAVDCHVRRTRAGTDSEWA